MKNNLKIKKEEYELYKVPYPLGKTNKAKKSYYLDFLQKEHPCFGNNFEYDVKTKLENGKLYSLIAVMDKIKLDRYKVESKKISLEGAESFNYFNDHDRKNVLLLILILMICLTAYILFINYKSNKSVNSIIEENNSTLVCESIRFSEPEIVISKILEVIKDNHGIINSLEVNADKAGDKSFVLFNMNISNCFPEKFMNIDFEDDCTTLNIDNISYKDNKPVLQLQINCQIPDSDTNKNIGNISYIRNLIIKNGGNVISENDDREQMECLVNKDKFSFVVKSLIDCCRENNIQLSSFLIKSSGGKINLSLSCSNSIYDSIPVLQKLESFEWFFENENKTSPKVKSDNKTVHFEKKDEKLEMIGKIVDKDGNVYVFYKDENGKIRGVKNEN